MERRETKGEPEGCGGSRKRKETRKKRGELKRRRGRRRKGKERTAKLREQGEVERN